MGESFRLCQLQTQQIHSYKAKNIHVRYQICCVVACVFKNFVECKRELEFIQKERVLEHQHPPMAKSELCDEWFETTLPIEKWSAYGSASVTTTKLWERETQVFKKSQRISLSFVSFRIKYPEEKGLTRHSMLSA